MAASDGSVGDSGLEADLLEAHMQMAGERTVLVPMAASALVELLRDHKLQEDQVLAIARDYINQEKKYAKHLAWEKLRLWHKINDQARNYVFAESDLLMEMRVFPSSTKEGSRRSNGTSNGTRAAPYTEPPAHGQS